MTRRSGASQSRAASDAGISLRAIRRIEHMQAETLPLGLVRRAFEPYDARVRVAVWWKGAELDRILDSAHAALVERMVGELQAAGWKTAVEVSFSEYGERGSMDILALQ